MSESLPPLDWKPSEPAPKVQEFAWPAPPLPNYPAPQPLAQAMPVEVTAANGSRSVGQLVKLLPAQRLAHLVMPPAKQVMSVRLNQLASLKLMRPVQTLSKAAPVPRTPYRVRLRNGQELRGNTLGHVQDELGLFLFPPMSPSDDTVQPLLVPREALDRADFGDAALAQVIEERVLSPKEADAAVQAQAVVSAAPRAAGGAPDSLLSGDVSNAQELLDAIDQQSRMPMVRIGEALQAMRLITPQQLDAALAAQKNDRSVPLGELLVRAKVVTRAQLQSALARKMGYPMVDIERFEPEAEALRKLPLAAAQRLEVLPLLLRDGRLMVAMEDPTRRQAIDEVEFITQQKVVPALARLGSVPVGVVTAYARIGATAAGELLAPISLDFEPAAAIGTDKLVETLEREQLERPELVDDRPIEQSDNSLVRLINNMIVEAHTQNVSDIHIECQPGKEKVRIRFRKDGVMAPYLELPPSYRNAMVARIKVMCELDISERRKPQDGKINFAKFSPQHKLELRVATIPTNNGLEDVVMRLLASAKPLPMDKLGLSPSNLPRLQEAIQRPYGLVLCVGPTGSGKTTTLHSVLGHINTPERKIWTAEDPVEITQAGLRQVQVNPKIDWTFAKALRAFLRADPDVIMVGEIRDQETAEIAIEASLTGHLVMSTLHTNSAAETVTRLLDMGTDPFNFGDSLLAVLAQRLVRRLCPHCRTHRPLSIAETDELIDDFLHAFPADMRPPREQVKADWLQRHAPNGQLQHFHSPGCAKCEGSGFKGRAGLHELLSVSREVRRLIQTGGRAEQIHHQGLAEGMRTLRQDGLDKVLQGVTSLAEVRATTNA